MRKQAAIIIVVIVALWAGTGLLLLNEARGEQQVSLIELVELKLKEDDSFTRKEKKIWLEAFERRLGNYSWDVIRDDRKAAVESMMKIVVEGTFDGLSIERVVDVASIAYVAIRRGAPPEAVEGIALYGFRKNIDADRLIAWANGYREMTESGIAPEVASDLIYNAMEHNWDLRAFRVIFRGTITAAKEGLDYRKMAAYLVVQFNDKKKNPGSIFAKGIELLRRGKMPEFEYEATYSTEKDSKPPDSGEAPPAAKPAIAPPAEEKPEPKPEPVQEPAPPVPTTTAPPVAPEKPAIIEMPTPPPPEPPAAPEVKAPPTPEPQVLTTPEPQITPAPKPQAVPAPKPQAQPVPKADKPEPAPKAKSAPPAQEKQLAAIPGTDAFFGRMWRSISSFLGVPYVWGGETRRGADCSGFVKTVFREMNVDLPRVSRDQWKVGKKVSSMSKLKRGDLVFFNTYGHGVSHVGIYWNEDTSEFVHASSSKGVTVSKLSNRWYKKRYLGGRRIIENGKILAAGGITDLKELTEKKMQPEIIEFARLSNLK